MSVISNNDSHPKPLVITRQFNDIDAYAEAIKPLNVTSNQLTPGLFVGSINFADFRGLKFTQVNHNQGFRAEGPKSPRDLTFAISLKFGETQVLSHGCPIKKQDIFGFDRERETDIVTKKDAHIVMASVDLLIFQSLAEQMGYDLGEKFLKQNLIRLHPSSLRHLRAYYQQIAQMLIEEPSLLMQTQMQSLIVEDFLPLLINTLGKSALQNRAQSKNFSAFLPCQKSRRDYKVL
ncbi:hypothetical protein [Nostoc sp. GT001]|uniref:hypothetical protein n=1 Tax=Nostoc sp. GT001 TaxID=3056647 RepID=UPI0025AA6594|nr:hypothetical protein [Nostoc sp. GT001]MDM9581417.1 hypothetical protein [Nostoc sp. GT001]